MYNVSADVKEAHNLIDDSSYAAEKARLQARMAYWTTESAHVKDQNALTADKRSNPYLNEQVVPGLRLHAARGVRL